MVVRFFQAGLMHMCMGVLGAVVMGMGVLVFDVVMFVGGVSMRVGDAAVLVFVRMRGFVRVVVVGHDP